MLQNLPSPIAGENLGIWALTTRGFATSSWWYWLGIGVLVLYTIGLNVIVVWAHTYLGRELPLLLHLA